MKVYSVHCSISIREIGPIESIEPKLPVSLAEGLPKDSPVNEVATLFDKMKEAGLFPSQSPVVAFPGMPSGANTASLEESVQVVADFEKVQGIISKYHAVTESLGIEAVR